ncbi:MAG: adenylyl-sulfate kinase [Candidatus Omnitrophica bacterium]|nr:adenylyl-sulfate kinase [Candidatus Omnitrophota bacterium]
MMKLAVDQNNGNAKKKEDAFVIWFTGISGSGKTTLANRLKTEFDKRFIKAEVLDGDAVREFFENDLGYSREERILNIKRITFAAMLLAKNGINVIVANIAPYYEIRDFIRRKLARNYCQIYLKASIEKVMSRDVKGLYGKMMEKGCKNIVGIDDSYDIPRNSDIIIDTDQETIDGSITRIVGFLRKKRIL